MKMSFVLSVAITSLSLPAMAQDQYYSSGTRGDARHTTFSTGGQGVPAAGTRTTVPQYARRPGVLGSHNVVPLPTILTGVGRARLSPMPVGGGGKNGLPQTRMDSFIFEAGGNAEDIYGDEGAVGLPPCEEFTQPHRIERGIHGVRQRGLTTLHGSYLPHPWGGDEWVNGAEFSMSGSVSSNGGGGGGSGAYNPEHNPPALPNLGPGGGSQRPNASFSASMQFADGSDGF